MALFAGRRRRGDMSVEMLITVILAIVGLVVVLFIVKGNFQNAGGSLG